MSPAEASWELRLVALWTGIETFEAPAFVAQIDGLTAELPSSSPIGRFERASALDSTGRPDLAIPMYRAALDAGLTGLRRRRATIQLASSLRNVGNAADAADLLFAELNADSDELDGAVRAFLALALVDLGREREAVGVSLEALSRYLPRYNRSLARYARAVATSCRDTANPSVVPSSPGG
ncbi:MAG: tetratricopeptide repeat protein [Casimicrobiaceae bacterium]